MVPERLGTAALNVHSEAEKISPSEQMLLVVNYLVFDKCLSSLHRENILKPPQNAQ